MQIKRIKYSDIEQTRPLFQKSENLKEDFFGSSPSVFIGHFGYPQVNVGLLAPQYTGQEAWILDAPRHWAKQNTSIPQILNHRLSLVNSRVQSNIKLLNKTVEIAQEIAMASRPVDLEINLSKRPSFHSLNDYIITPMGPQAQIKNAKITENPKIDTRVEKVVSQTDLKSADALTYLYKKDFDENFLTKLISTANLGLKFNRKLVPTRWSITAVDDTLGKFYHQKIKEFEQADYQAFFGSHLGNYFLVMFFPEIWAYELFETYLPKTEINRSQDIQYSTDHEFFKGRQTYAENCAGGYYAARLPILEKLHQIKRQATVLTLRFITEEYRAPLGVWVVREAVRKTMEEKPIKFASEELMLNYVKLKIKKMFNFDAGFLIKNSLVLKEMKKQTKLSFFAGS